MKKRFKFGLLGWLFLILILWPVVIIFCWNLDRVIYGSDIVRHKFIYSSISKYINSKGVVPQNLNQIDNIGEWKDIDKFDYYPDAWGKGEILVISPIRSQYIVTFGNESIAVLNYWSSGDGKKNIGALVTGWYGILVGGVVLIISVIVIILILKIVKKLSKT